MLPEGALSGRVALVTGGGSGLGFSIAQGILALGADHVVIASRSLPRLEKAAEELLAFGKERGVSGDVHALTMDVRNAEQVKAVADQVESLCGGRTADLLVNNAAGNFVAKSQNLSANAFSTVVDIVLNGTANVTLEFGRRLIEREQPASVVSITTTYAATGSGFVLPSAAAKAGVEALTKSLAAEWGRYGIRFNAIQPGPIRTKGAFSRLDPTGELEQNMIGRIPTGRLGERSELSNLACYLLSDYSNWVTGSVYKFDGGESTFMAGEFNDLVKITDKQWEMMEALIRNKAKS